MFIWEFHLPMKSTPILEIRIAGHVDLETLNAQYLPRLRAELDKHVLVGLVVDCREMSGFDVAVPKAHAIMLNDHLNVVHSVAVITQSSLASFGVAAASLALRKRPLRAFESREEAYAWSSQNHRKAARA